MVNKKRPFGLSIITAAGLVGIVYFLFNRRGVSKAISTALDLGFSLQLIPLRLIPGVSENSDTYLHWGHKIAQHNNNIIAYEDRWGGDDPLHPWRHLDHGTVALIGYYLFFPIRNAEVRRQLYWLRTDFPSAIAIDCGESSAREVSPNTNQDVSHWTRLANTGRPIVIDTYHLQHGWEHGQGGISLLSSIKDAGGNVKLVQVQFRSRITLRQFLIESESMSPDKTAQILRSLRSMIGCETPVVIELSPLLVKKKDLPKTLERISQRVSKILDG